MPPVAAWVQANVDKAIETAMDCIAVAGSGVRVATGYKMDDQACPAMQVEMSKSERVFRGGKALVEAGVIVGLGLKGRGGSGRTKADIVRENYAKGKAYEAKVGERLKATQTDVVEQITVKTESGVRTQLDFAGLSSADGSIRLTEAKSSATARLTRNQQIAPPEIGAAGATVVGKGKVPFTGGTRIPPTPVEVVRPKAVKTVRPPLPFW